jgi:hypothetical protein
MGSATRSVYITHEYKFIVNEWPYVSLSLQVLWTQFLLSIKTDDTPQRPRGIEADTKPATSHNIALKVAKMLSLQVRS